MFLRTLALGVDERLSLIYNQKFDTDDIENCWLVNCIYINLICLNVCEV